jgi:hypothetical protein
MPVPRLSGRHSPDHPSFDVPPEDTVIWRYMDFTKFAALLDRQALYCASVASFADRFEGSPTAVTMEAIARDNPEHPGMGEQLRAGYAFSRRSTYANCWNQDAAESVALWSMYTSPSGGVAIRSTVGQLIDAVEAGEAEEDTDESVFVGAMRYIDHVTTVIPVDNMFNVMMHKRLGYRFEQEVRMVIDPTGYLDRKLREIFGPTEESRTMQQTASVAPAGFDLVVDVNRLVTAVVVAPEAPAWLVELVQHTCVRYGLDVAVSRSDLEVEPLYRTDL